MKQKIINWLYAARDLQEIYDPEKINMWGVKVLEVKEMCCVNCKYYLEPIAKTSIFGITKPEGCIKLSITKQGATFYCKYWEKCK